MVRSWVENQMTLRPCSPPRWVNGRIDPQCGITDGQRGECCYEFEREQSVRPTGLEPVREGVHREPFKPHFHEAIDAWNCPECTADMVAAND